MKLTYHMTPTEVWDNLADDQPYASPSLAEEGFIHCTDGVDNMIVTADRHYRDDERSFYVLTLDLDALQSPWRYDDKPIYPHIYGPVNPDAVVRVLPFERGQHGDFRPFEE